MTAHLPKAFIAAFVLGLASGLAAGPGAAEDPTYPEKRDLVTGTVGLPEVMAFDPAAI